jgi:hypothetical protein
MSVTPAQKSLRSVVLGDSLDPGQVLADCVQVFDDGGYSVVKQTYNGGTDEARIFYAEMYQRFMYCSRIQLVRNRG